MALASLDDLQGYNVEWGQWKGMLIFSNVVLKVNNRNTRTKCEICSKLTVETPERCRKSTISTSECIPSRHLHVQS